MRTTHGLHKCPTCSQVVGEAHNCNKIKVTSMSLKKAKEWLNNVIISRALR